MNRGERGRRDDRGEAPPAPTRMVGSSDPSTALDPGAVQVVLDRPGCVAVQVIDLDVLPLPDPVRAGMLADLDDVTLARIARLRVVEDQDRSIAVHALLRRWLAPTLGVGPREVGVDRRCASCGGLDHGRPRLSRAMDSRLQFSLSHSGRRVAVALSASPVGVDVQETQPLRAWEEIRHLVFTDREWHEGMLDPAPARRFTALWSQKEAALKAWGTGFGSAMARVHLAATTGGTDHDGLVVTGPGADGARWSHSDVSGPATAHADALHGWTTADGEYALAVARGSHPGRGTSGCRA